ncbi:hypothetical protein BDN72DRAFT_462329 [Pluteus cervinus]|uniref:Uncharacterized protein n=1 Tax=Pluteus cervinus TaxID=181527 RepID=A0ACD3B171_9AGAR|nr:hypothetical protein BDN72DRAFT_462329 [Pluteus cervinus]
MDKYVMQVQYRISGHKDTSETLTILDLPSEIVTDIFQYCTSGVGPIVLPADTAKPPWTLLSVCSDWRDLALEASELWSCMRIDLRSVQDMPKVLGLARTLIQRSGNRPLLISNSANMNDPKMYEKTVQFVQDIVMPAARRLRSLSYEGWVEAIVPLLTSPPGSLPILEKFEMWGRRLTSQDDLFKIQATAFQSAPHLRTVVLRAQYNPADPTLLNLSWHQLTTLRIVDLYVCASVLSTLLSQCVNLVNLTIDEAFPPGPGWNPAQYPIFLPTVTIFDGTLSTREYGPGVLLSALCFPNLQYLTLRIPQTTQFRHLEDGIDAFARRSFANLKGLCIIGMSPTSNLTTYEHLLDHISLVVTELQVPLVEYRSISFSQTVLSRLIPRLEMAPSSLRFLVLQVLSCDLENGTLAEVEEFHARRGLESVRMLIEGSIGAAHQQKVDELNEKALGMTVEIVPPRNLPMSSCVPIEWMSIDLSALE